VRIIYEPRGRALEYAPLAVSLYRGCPHGCVYCFAPESTRTEREKFMQAYPRKDALRKLELDCKELAAANDQREILMSFTCDPYQPLDEELALTRTAIRILIDHGLHFTILTKGGARSRRDRDLLFEHPELCRYGTTLVFSDEQDRALWEPNAAPTAERIKVMKGMHAYLKTWVSLEPVIYPAQTLELIRQTVDFVDEYRIGKFNHAGNPELERFLKEIGYFYPTSQGWIEIVKSIKALLDETGSRYIFKKDLLPYLQAAGGCR
jgi:DNA repair photolyase